MAKCDKCGKEEKDLCKVYYCNCDKICCEECRFCSSECRRKHEIEWEVFSEMNKELFINNLAPSCLCLWPGRCANENCEFKQRCRLKNNKLFS